MIKKKHVAAKKEVRKILSTRRYCVFSGLFLFRGTREEKSIFLINSLHCTSRQCVLKFHKIFGMCDCVLSTFSIFFFIIILIIILKFYGFLWLGKIFLYNKKFPWNFWPYFEQKNDWLPLLRAEYFGFKKTIVQFTH